MPILPLLKTAAFDPEATKTLASVFDSAWSVLLRSGSGLATDENAIVTREVLAKRIIAMGRTGERDQHRLVNDARSCGKFEIDVARGLANCRRMVTALI
jgi:hypothetical protein